VLLVVVRHAKAEEKSDFTGNDRLRPLTEGGREKMRQAARALRSRVPDIDLLASSPLVRAQQTAAILQDEYGIKKIETTETLSPGLDREEFMTFLKKASEGAETVCVVGHEPDLGELCSWLLSGRDRGFISFRKGSVCLLEFSGPVAAGRAQMLL
jgi:phosphohistidine phosphatase